MKKYRIKNKWLRRLKNTILTVIIITCLLYIFILPVRSSPEDRVETYSLMAKAFRRTEFILPSEELIPNDKMTYSIIYAKNSIIKGDVGIVMFGQLGLLAEKKMYTIYHYKKAYRFFLRGRKLNEDELKAAKKDFVPNKVVDGIQIQVSETKVMFFVDNFVYSISSDEEDKLCSIEQLEEIATDMIARAK